MKLTISKQTARALEKCIRLTVLAMCNPETQKLDPVRLQHMGISVAEIELMAKTSKQIKNHLNTTKK